VQPPQPAQLAVEEDEFTDYTQPASVAREEVISFDTLMSQHKQTSPQPHYQSYNGLKTQNMTLHHPYNPNIAQHNLVYNAHFQPQPQQQQYQTQNQAHGYSSNYPLTHAYSPVAHNYPSMGHNFAYQQPQQFNMGYNTQVGVGNYWK
jgi:hypothetical protein